MKFSEDRRRWLQWLYEARRSYGLTILNYMVTSNHIHLLVVDDGDRDMIPRSIQLAAGRTGQEYNQRKTRKGHFWKIDTTQRQWKEGKESKRGGRSLPASRAFSSLW